jgi:hypothetical protein
VSGQFEPGPLTVYASPWMRQAALLLCLFASGCKPDCVASDKIQLTIVPASSVNMALVSTLRMVLSVDSGAPKLLDVAIASSKPLKQGPTQVLLVPDSQPTKPHYNVALTVEALDSLGALLAVGTSGGDVAANGCNRLSAQLEPLLGNGDGGLPDLAFPVVADLTVPANADLTMPDGASTDLACSATPDEDSDGRGDACDLCPADYDPMPVDTDGDGLPDACDPDPMMGGNSLIYFEPFNTDSGHWSEMPAMNWSMSDSELVVQTMSQGRLISGNGTDTLPVNVRVQTFVHMPFVEAANPSTADSDVGIALTNEPDSASTTDGVLCALSHTHQGTDTLDVDTISNGAIVNTQSTSMPFGNDTGPPQNQLVIYRLRLTQRGKMYTCEAVTSGVPMASVSTTLTQAPEGPQFMLLRATNVEAHFMSVVAETANP